MRPPVLFTLLLFSLCAVAFGYGWSKEDHEIFRLRDELELIEGEGVTFYDFVGVKNGPAASMDDINKAYRKTSARLHPDKFKASKDNRLTRSQHAAERTKASERFARLGVITNILRGPERDRYNHFLRNGFPKWRGTGYYYARLRPGLGTVLVGVYLAAAVAHYVVLRMNATRQRAFMMNIIKEARHTAFGAAGVPGLAAVLGEEEEEAATAKPKKDKKKKKEAGSGEAPAVTKRRVSYGGKSLVVDSTGDVFLLDESEDGIQELLLDPSEIEDAKWTNTLLVGLPRGIWNITLGRFIGGKKTTEDAYDDSDSEEGETAVEGEAVNGAKKKTTAKKVERTGDGAPRRRTKGRAGKSYL